MEAVQAASVLDNTGAKADVLADVIRAAALTAPERIGWLADEAETAARSLEHPTSREGYAGASRGGGGGG